MLHRHIQGLRKWDGGSGVEPETRRIRAEAPCPLPPLSTAVGDYQALNLCPSCRTAYFFRPHLPVPLQGTFIEVGCARAVAPDGHQPESLRSNPHPRPPFPQNLNVVRVSGGCGGVAGGFGGKGWVGRVEPGEGFADAQGDLRGARQVCDRAGESQEEYQEKINSCKEKIDRAKVETIADDELNALQNEMEEKIQDEQQLRQDLRAVRDELDNLDRQRASIEERKDAVKKKEKDMMKAQNMLSMCVSVTNIMPDFEDQDKISGYIVDKNMKKLEKFEFEKTAPPVEICNKLWKMI